jgi:geranylgeranylglycerol-phosphate geranylgeranyltransferase
MTAGSATAASVRDVVLAHVALLRLYSVLPLVLLSCGIGAALGVAPLHLAAAATAITCALAGGYAYNDLRDQQLDRLNRPRRPLVSGVLPEPYVRRMVLVLYGNALLFAAATASLRTIAFVVLLTGSACLYSDAIKHTPGLKNVFVGIWCGLLPWGTALDRTTVAMWPAVLLVMLFITQKELLADVYDRPGDAAAGVRTIPVLCGPRAGLALVAMLNAVLWVVARGAADVPVLVHLPRAGEVVPVVNLVALAAVFYRMTLVRACLEVQKAFMIGGCLALFAALIW